ncbi:MAG: hypothetical protein A3H70_03940 [Candidatus Komeilibacteria bacterium RIFCSPLOWO2_02_FULL_48_11]|uniref:RNA polymerase sigma factor 70 region 4 type 2 domain-containing protein n=1 Tax=Candidatus Komeilibacteria bacterium RIFCSPLOWO2_02_FULL_48_11 TaxID=1798553 RepID=A0A1G2BP06_9BACT|nr:MAG: hypothetical protein A3H70_03940 [Candidatus Komeilibacteria bacterium RIFCSPLOWO2_02_FULL_48_11]
MHSNNRDRFLLEAVLAGDEEAFGRLYDKYVVKIYRFVSFRVGSKESAEDLTAEIFLKTWQYVKQGSRQIENVKALIYRIAANAIIDHYRQSGNEYLALSEDCWNQIVDQTSLSDEAQKKDDLRQVYQAIKFLSPADRELVLMRYSNDLSVKEIAEILGKNPGAIRTALHRALKTLKAIIKNQVKT